MQTSGELDVQQYVDIGYGQSAGASYSLSGGILDLYGIGPQNPPELHIVGSSSFTQTGYSDVYVSDSGTVSVAADPTNWGGTLGYSGSGTYTLGANSGYGLECNEIDVGNSYVSSTGAVFDWESGSLYTNQVVLTNGGTFKLSITGSVSTSVPFSTNDGNIDIPSDATNFTIASVIAGNELTKSGDGTLTLTGNNTFSGGTTINGGVLAVATDDNLGSGGFSLSLNGGTLEVDGAGFAISRSVILDYYGGGLYISSGQLSIANLISGPGRLTVGGAGEAVISDANNTYSGGTAILGGMISISSDSALGTSSNVELNGGVLEYTGTSGATARIFTLDSSNGEISITNASAVLTSNGYFTGSGGLIKDGSGTLSLSSNNTYTGGTEVASGKLQLVGKGTLGTGPVILAGGQLATVGIPSLSNNIVVSDSASSSIRADGSDLTLSGGFTGGGTVTRLGSGSVYLAGDNSGFTGTYINAAARTRFTSPDAGSESAQWQFTSQYESTFDFNNGTISLGSISGSSPLRVNTSFTGVTLSVGALNMDSTYTGRIYDNGPGSTLTLEKVGTGKLTVSSLRLSAVNVTNGKLAIASNGTAAGTTVVKSLNISSGATMDLTNNAMVVDYDTTSPAGTIRGYLKTAYDDGSWDLPGLNSSAVAGQYASSVGYAEASDVLTFGGSPTATFAGQTVDATSVLVMFTWEGDRNLDGTVDSTDLLHMSPNPTYNAVWSMGDFNYDGEVNGDDYALFELGDLFQSGSLMPMGMSAGQFLAEREAEFNGESTALIRSQIAKDLGWNTSIASVPEPGVGVSMAVLGGLGAVRRRRLKRDRIALDVSPQCA